MATTIGSLDLNAFSDLYSDSTQYFWFESNASATYGAGAHVTLVPDTSFISNPTGQNILMNTDGFSIRNGLLPMMTLDNDSLDFNVVDTVNGTYTNVASFGASSTIGVSDGTQSYMYLDFHSLQMIDKEGDAYFDVNDLRDSDGYYNATETFTGDGENVAFPLFASDGVNTSSSLKVWVDGSIVSSYTFNNTSGDIIFTTPPADNSEIVATYTTTSNRVKAYTLGTRIAESNTGMYSYALGYQVTASGSRSHAEGHYTIASGRNSHAEGMRTTARGVSSHAEGWFTIASELCSHAEGASTTASGMESHAEGDGTTASGDFSHAEGWDTTASGYCSHAEGRETTASGVNTHAEGRETTASGGNTHAEGSYTTASELASHAEGDNTTASGVASHAEGISTTASGNYSHAGGSYTTAQRKSQTALGEYNIADTGGTDETTRGDYAFIIGNGTDDNARSNALTVDWSGNITINNHDSEIGHVYSDSKLVAISNTTIDHNTDGASLSLSAGVYIVVGQWHFNTRTTTGTTNSAIRLYRSGSSDSIAQTRVMAGDSNWNSLQCTAIVTLTSTETVKVCGATSRPYTTAQGTYISAVRIK